MESSDDSGRSAQIDSIQKATECIVYTQDSKKIAGITTSQRIGKYDCTFHTTNDQHTSLHTHNGDSSSGEIRGCLAWKLSTYVPYFRLVLGQGYLKAHGDGQKCYSPEAYRDLLDSRAATATGLYVVKPEQVAATIGFKAFKEIRTFIIDDDHIPMLSEQQKDAYKGIKKSRGSPAIFVEIRFDLDCMASDNILVNAPTYAIPWIEEIKQGVICGIVPGHSQTAQELSAVGSLLRAWQNANPLNAFHGGISDRAFKIDKLTKPPQPSYGLKLDEIQLSHQDDDEIATMLAHSTMCYIADSEAKRKAYEAVVQDLVLIPLPGTSNPGKFLGFLTCPASNDLNLDDNARIFVKFPVPASAKLKHVKRCDTTEETSPAIWCGWVTADAAFTPKGYLTIRLDRPYLGPVLGYDYQIDAKILDVKNVEDLQKLPGRIRYAKPNSVRVRLDCHEAVLRQNMEAIDDLYCPSSLHPLVEFNSIAKDLLKFNVDFTTKYGERDVYCDVRDEFPRPEDIMTLELQQRTTIKSLRNALAGFALVHGPPGTGKTHLIGEMSKPFLRHSNHHLLLMVCPSNQAANAMTETLSTVLVDLKGKNLVDPDAYILRAHATSTEEKIFMRASHFAKSEPATVDASVSKSAKKFTTAEAAIDDAYQKGNRTEYLDIRDPRLTHHSLSIGYRMLHVAGLLENSKQPYEGWAIFRGLYIRRCQKADLDEDEEALYETEYDRLFKEVCQKAQAIIATPFQVGRIMRSIEKEVKALFIDEACRESVVNLMPVLNGRFENLRGCIQVGDPLQLPPTLLLDKEDKRDDATNNKEVDMFRDRLELSLFSQMSMQGWPFAFLDLQSRMVKQIATIAQDFTYGRRFQSSSRVDMVNRPFATIFQHYVKKLTGGTITGCNALAIDIADQGRSVTEIKGRGSRYNLYYVRYLVNIAVEILTDFQILFDTGKISRMPSIALVSGYKAQVNLYKSCISAMKLDRTKNFDCSTLHCLTIDGSQAKEFDFVLMDILLLPRKAPGFLTDHRRLNVGTTRARDGMILVTSFAQADKYVMEDGQIFNDLLSCFPERYKLEAKDGFAELPVCKYAR